MSKPVVLPGVACDSKHHSKWAIRRTYVESKLLPQIQRLGFQTADFFEAITDDHFTLDARPGPHGQNPYGNVTLGTACFNFTNLSNHEIGGFLSHYQLWELCVKLGQPVLILEDDALLPLDNEKPVTEAMRYYESLPDMASLLYLQSQVPYAPNALKSYPSSTLGSKLGPLIQLNTCQDLAGTTAYCIQPAAALNLMARGRVRGMSNVDGFIHRALNEQSINVLIPQDCQRGIMLNEHWAAWNH